MLTIKGTHFRDALSTRGTVVTMGNFDGVHRGHQKVILEARARARRRQCSLAVITFDPHPEQVLSPEAAPKLLTTVEEKEWIMNRLGVDVLWVLPFTLELAGLPADAFFRRFVIEEAGAQEIVLGHDHRFGTGAQGNFSLVRDLTHRTNIKADILKPEMVEGQAVSSTWIRKWVSHGDFENAMHLLGYPYLISGQVVRGRGLGREMGFPTINLGLVQLNKLLPPPGIYSAQVCAQNRIYDGAFYLGRKPTFGGNETSLEIHLLDFNGDLYGAHVLIYMRRKLREDRKFDSVDSLARQIQADIAQIRAGRNPKQENMPPEMENFSSMEDLCP